MSRFGLRTPKEIFHERPREGFDVDYFHPLAKGLVFAGLGGGAGPGGLRYQDSSLYGNHGTLTNTPTWEWSNDLGRWALNSSSSSGYALMGAVLKSTTTYSVAFWCKRSTDNVYYFSTEEGGDGAWSTDVRFSDATPSYATFYKKVGYGSASATSSVAIPTATWMHVAATCDSAGGLTIWVNGVATGTGTKAGTFSPTRVVFMANAAPTGKTNNRGSDFLCYSRALSLSEISAIADRSNVMLSGLLLPPKRRVFGAVTAAPAADIIELPALQLSI